jgi:Tol biopolymer transport system component
MLVAAIHRIKVKMIMLILAACSLLCQSAAGQYFGQNKVRYNPFDFKVLKTEHFDIYYYPEEKEIIEQVGRMAERWYFRLSSVLELELSGRQPLIIYADHPDFQQTLIIPGIIGEATGGVTESIRRRIVMPLAGPLGETDHVIGHELVHTFQYDLSSRARKSGVSVSIEGLPLWFIEGMSEYLSVGPVDPFTSMWMRDAVIREELPDIGSLDNPKYFPYRWGQAVWAFIAGTYGDKAVGRILKAAAKSGNAGKAITSILDISMKDLSKNWHQALKNQYQPILRLTNPSNSTGEIIVSKKRSDSELNVCPVISPDGRYVMLFSEKSLFSINLYLADAKSGKLLRKITETAISPHFINLQFTNAAGAWSPDGKRFAFARVRGATPELSIYDVEKDETVREIPVEEVGEIFSLSWSPDGSSIVFAANAKGISDLFSIDLAGKKVDRLTDDEYGDMQPSWSPDGTKIAFATDRFTSDLASLSFGEYRLAVLDAATGDIEELHAFDTGKQINPEWSADGSSLFFISDHFGISNIYRLSMSDNRVHPVTNLDTGVSGITNFSPSLSVARGAGSLMFSVFAESGAYQVHRTDIREQKSGLSKQSELARHSPGVLPPGKPRAAEVSALLNEPSRGLEGTKGFERKNYSVGLQLDYIGPASVSVGTSRYGSLVGGGIGFHFSDMLNFHELGIQVQTTTISGLHPERNISAIATYLNKRSRWTWGFSGGQVPYYSTGFSQNLGQIEGQPVVIQNDTTFWQINRQAVGLLQYPFSRAMRLEFSSGFQALDFAASTNTRVYDYFSGVQIGSRSTDLDAPDSLYMSASSAALVYDTSVFGGVSPVIGRRFRFEGGFYAGSLLFTTALADIRQYYQIFRPLSLSGRILHYGRYGVDAEDNRMQPIYLGYSSILRGYEPGSLSAAECGPELSSNGTCPIFDRLNGSRIGVANVEVRLQILGPLGIIPSRGFPPVEIAPFLDAGIAWTKDSTPDFFGGSRRGVSSYGASLRFNMLGMAIGQISLVHPNDRPLKGWFWEFSFLPGF